MQVQIILKYEIFIIMLGEIYIRSWKIDFRVTKIQVLVINLRALYYNLFLTRTLNAIMKNNYFIIIITLCFLNFTSVFSQTVASKKLNSTGFDFYKAKNYKQAASSFAQSIEVDPTNYIAHFNLACTYSILTTLHENCDVNYYAKAIKALEKCFELDSKKTKNKAIKDSDFDGIRNEYEFNVLVHNLSFENPKHVKDFITNKQYSTEAPGSSYFPIEDLTLNKDSTWSYRYHKNAKEMSNYYHGGDMEEPAPTIVIGIKEGNWNLDGYILTLKNKNNSEFMKFTIKKAGEIGQFYYPNPNDMSGDYDVRHHWNCGKCGCQPIEALE